MGHSCRGKQTTRFTIKNIVRSGYSLSGRTNTSCDLTVPYECSLRVALAVYALPGACRSLSATCCESNTEVNHHLAMPREAIQPSAGSIFSLSAQKWYSHVCSTLPLNSHVLQPSILVGLRHVYIWKQLHLLQIEAGFCETWLSTEDAKYPLLPWWI